MTSNQSFLCFFLSFGSSSSLALTSESSFEALPFFFFGFSSSSISSLFFLLFFFLPFAAFSAALVFDFPFLPGFSSSLSSSSSSPLISESSSYPPAFPLTMSFHSSSVSTVTPNASARSSFVPAPGPATKKLVFFETALVTLAPTLIA